MNKVVLIGRLTRDPELRTTPTGVSTCNFSLAVSRNFKNKDGVVEADFINVIVWRKQAENVSKYCFKGSQVCVEGRIQTRNYDDKDGTKRYITEIIADNVEFLGTKKDNSTNNYVPQDTYNTATIEETTQIPEEDPFKDFGNEVVLSDDDLPF